MGVSDSARRQSAADGAQPFLDPDKLLARAARAGAAGLRLLDLAPVVVIRRHDAPLLQKRLKARCSGPVARAPRRHGGRDLVGDFVAIGPVGPDRPTGAAAGPADGIKPVADPPALVDKLAALKRHVRDRRG